MSTASSSCQGSFDVFLNFRGEDTRNGFTAHLYEALCNKEIQTFMDADKIVKGQEISPALVTAIHNSMFSVVVLSKNYASSTWCLDELVQILKCKNAKKQTVLPIFYDVNPSDVREQKGSFTEAFAKHEKKFKEKKGRVQMWKQALTEVASITGWDARKRHEPTLIKEIIQHISSRLINGSSKDDKAMIRVDSHILTSDLLYGNESRKRSIDDDFPIYAVTIYDSFNKLFEEEEDDMILVESENKNESRKRSIDDDFPIYTVSIYNSFNKLFEKDDDDDDDMILIESENGNESMRSIDILFRFIIRSTNFLRGRQRRR